MYPNPLRDGFSLTELTQAINVLPNQYGMITQMNLFTQRPLTQNTLVIEYNRTTLALVPTTPWGGVAPRNNMGKRDNIALVVPHMPFEDTVKASEVMGIRKFGTENVAEAVSDRVADKLQTMKNKIDQTLEYRRMGALKGVVLDADGVTVLANYFTAFGISQPTFAITFSSTTEDIRGQLVAIRRYMEDNAHGASWTSLQALVSPEFFDALVTHPTVKAAYANTVAAVQNFGGDLAKVGFTWGDINFKEYRGIVNGERFIAPGTGYIFPIGSTDVFSEYMAPADFLETVNTVALPYYARQSNMDMNRGIDLHVQSNILPVVTRPQLLVEITMD